MRPLEKWMNVFTIKEEDNSELYKKLPQFLTHKE